MKIGLRTQELVWEDRQTDRQTDSEKRGQTQSYIPSNWGIIT